MRRLAKHIAIILIGMLVSCETRNSFNPPDENYFLKYFGNAGNQEGIDFVVNPDGTFVLLGNSRATPLSDQQVYVAKADAKGNIIWEKTFGGKFDEEAKDIELLPDGNLILLANSANNSSADPATRERDVMLIKLGQDGSKMDSVKQGLTSDDNNAIGPPTDDDASSISIISDGFLVAGSKGDVPQASINKSSFIHMRFRNDLSWVADGPGSSWNTEPIKSLDGENKAVKIIPYNSGFYVMGYTNNNYRSGSPKTADFNFIIYGLGPDAGDLGRIFIGDISSDEKLTSISIAPPQLGGGYLLTGTSQNLSDADIYFARISNSIVYNQFATSNYISAPFRIKQGNTFLQSTFNSSTTTSFYVASEKVNGTSSNIFLTKLNSDGNQIFERTFGGIGNDFAGPVVELPDGHIVMIGTFTLGGVVDGQKKIVFMKLNKEGRLAP